MKPLIIIANVSAIVATVSYGSFVLAEMQTPWTCNWGRHSANDPVCNLTGATVTFTGQILAVPLILAFIWWAGRGFRLQGALGPILLLWGLSIFLTVASMVGTNI